jgi:hypothetical protein
VSSRQARTLVFTKLRGRDGSTASVGVPPELGGIPYDKCLEAMNVDWYRADFARKRGGASSLSLTFSSGGPFSGRIVALGAHVPSAALSAAELWAIDNSGQIGRLAGGTTWTEPTIKDAPTTPYAGSFCSLNGKLYMAYPSAVDRLHCWDGTEIRRTGMGTPAAPTVANTGAGAYAATLRYYRVRYTVQSGGVTLRRGEASASTSFTPSGGGTAARVTKPASLSEGETHWELEVSLDNAVWYVLATTAVGTTTYDDSAATTTYATNSAAPLAGAYINWTAAGFLSTDGNRLLGAGSWSGSTYSRVWFSPVLGTTSSAFFDDERVPETVEQKNYIDLTEKNGAFITGISRPHNNAIWVFKNTEIHKLIPTGIDTTPYRATLVSQVIGCVRHQTIVHAVDENGRPALYWLSNEGPYRVTEGDGIQFLGDDIQDVWDTVDVSTLYGVSAPAHGVYHAEKHQIWWWVPVDGSLSINRRIVFDVRLGRLEGGGRVRGGWSVHSGDSCAAQCSVMFSSSVGAAMSVDQSPYVSKVGGASPTVLKCDTSDTDDAGTAFQAYVTLPDRHYGDLNHECAITGAAALGSAGSHTLTLTLTPDYGAETARTATATFTAAGSETRKLKAFEGAAVQDADAVQVKIGDASATANNWTLDALIVKTEQRMEQAQA